MTSPENIRVKMGTKKEKQKLFKTFKGEKKSKKGNEKPQTSNYKINKY